MPDDANHHPDADPHVEWARGAADLEAHLTGLPDETEDDEAALEPLQAELHELHKLWDLLCTTPSSTAAGAREQVLRAIRVHDQGSVLGDTEATGLRHAAATLEQLAEESRAFAELRARLADLRDLRSRVDEAMEHLALELAELEGILAEN